GRWLADRGRYQRGHGLRRAGSRRRAAARGRSARPGASSVRGRAPGARVVGAGRIAEPLLGRRGHPTVARGWRKPSNAIPARRASNAADVGTLGHSSYAGPAIGAAGARANATIPHGTRAAQRWALIISRNSLS